MYGFILFISIAAFSVLVIAALMFSVFQKELIATERIRTYVGIGKTEPPDSVEKKKTTQKSGLWHEGTVFLEKYMPLSDDKRISMMLRDAGYIKKMTAAEFRLIQLTAAFASGFLVFFMFLLLGESGAGAMLGMALAFLGWRIPVFYIKKKRDQRIKRIDLEMPDFFDTVNLLVEAGVGVDAAIASVCKKKEGPLSDEFMIVLDDMKRGKSKREAFHDLKRRVPSESFQSIVTSMIQADQLGIGLSNVLRNLTIRIREQRREKARELAMKAPVKMLFPMVFFIFPALFIVVLGPFVVNIMVNGMY
jgi:tight adherence protein C